MRYGTRTREQLKWIWDLANEDGLTNRAAYLKPLVDWSRSVVQYSITVIDDIQALPDAASVIGYTWDIAGNTLPDPKVKIADALNIQS